MRKYEYPRDFLANINLPHGDGCWEWKAKSFVSGYGGFPINGKVKIASRLSYQYFYGVGIPEGMVIDHICRNRPCVRPDHLRIVTTRINAIENSTAPSALNAIKTHCPRGHEYNEVNTYYGSNGRCCRKCMAMHQRKYKETRRASA
jgi:hypothetical protein